MGARTAQGGDRRVRTLVTGGAGFIGSHIVDAVLGRGDEVMVLDDLSTGREENVRDAIGRGMTLFVGDIRDAGFVDALLRRNGPRWSSTSRRRSTFASR